MPVLQGRISIRVDFFFLLLNTLKLAHKLFLFVVFLFFKMTILKAYKNDYRCWFEYLLCRLIKNDMLFVTCHCATLLIFFWNAMENSGEILIIKQTRSPNPPLMKLSKNILRTKFWKILWLCSDTVTSCFTLTVLALLTVVSKQLEFGAKAFGMLQLACKPCKEHSVCTRGAFKGTGALWLGKRLPSGF